MKKTFHFTFAVLILLTVIVLASLSSCSKEDDLIAEKPDLENPDNNGEEDNGTVTVNDLKYTFAEATIENNTLHLPFTIENGTKESVRLKSNYYNNNDWLLDDWGLYYNYSVEFENQKDVYTLEAKKKVEGKITVKELAVSAAKVNLHITLHEKLTMKAIDKAITGRVSSLPENKYNQTRIISGIEFTALCSEVSDNACAIYYKIKNTKSKTIKFNLGSTSSSTEDSWVIDDWGYIYKDVYNNVGNVDSKYGINNISIPSGISLYGKIHFKNIRNNASLLNLSLRTSLSEDYRADNLPLEGRQSSLPKNVLDMKQTIDGIDLTVLNCTLKKNICTVNYKIRNTNATPKKIYIKGTANDTWIMDDWGFSYWKALHSLGNSENEIYGINTYLPSNINRYGSFVIKDINAQASKIFISWMTNLSNDFRIDDIPLPGRTSALPTGKAKYEIVYMPETFDINFISCKRNADKVLITYSVKNLKEKTQDFSLATSLWGYISNQNGEKWDNSSIKFSFGEKRIPSELIVYGQIALSKVKQETTMINIKSASNSDLNDTDFEIKNLVIE
ncbi:hypothetical protein [Phocaeicola sartorii]|uniref:Uncharacterized protein n=1 Tax=Phocaeicola sartorii TaxID=671267 RepID=R9HXM1_9BACT|nr:hypothetical protein [Phocaeicola sartorii]EOS08768.1 hypothetical protein C802_04379 [Phocaeicola sartorii]MCR1846596.1 hypothetical protein [Phocaeicola sartorii]